MMRESERERETKRECEREKTDGPACARRPARPPRAAYETVRPYATPTMYRFFDHFSLTCVDGKADVRSVSCVSSIGRRRGE